MFVQDFVESFEGNSRDSEEWKNFLMQEVLFDSE
jgi:hypothetical protein